jgi:hypothetical protein
MVGFTINAIAREAIETYDEALITQMSSYKQHDSVGDAESYGGAAGRHDDIITAFEIMVAVMRLEMRALFSVDDPLFVDQGSPGEDLDLPNWDPFEVDLPMPGIPGMRLGDLDQENFEDGEEWSW